MSSKDMDSMSDFLKRSAVGACALASYRRENSAPVRKRSCWEEAEALEMAEGAVMYLDIRELGAAAQVCKAWRKGVATEMAARGIALRDYGKRSSFRVSVDHTEGGWFHVLRALAMGGDN